MQGGWCIKRITPGHLKLAMWMMRRLWVARMVNIRGWWRRMRKRMRVERSSCVDCMPLLHLGYCTFATMVSNRYNVIGIDWWYMGSASVGGETGWPWFARFSWTERKSTLKNRPRYPGYWNISIDPAFPNTLKQNHWDQISHFNDSSR